MSAPAEPLPLDPTKLVVATLSDAGRVSPENQDAAVALVNVSNERLLVVADGMGGQRGGETASKLCLDTLGRAFRDPHGTPEERLRRGLELANEEVYSHALSNPEQKGMGAAVVALLLSTGERGVWVAWVGDARCYRLRAGALEPLTRDHSLMAEWIAMGVIQADEVANHPRRNELTRAIGQAPDVNVEIARVDARPGDRFVLCSDGVHLPVPERMLKAAVAGPSPDEVTRALIEKANANGGPDNATVIVVDLPPEAFHAGAIEQMPEFALELELPSPPPPPKPPEPEPVVAAVTPPTPVTAPAAGPSPAPEPEPPQSEVFGMDFEATSHSSAAIDAALAEIESARLSPEDSAPSLDDSLPQVFEAAPEPPSPPAPAAAPTPPPAPAPGRAEELAAETSFADLMDDAPAELTPPPPVTPAAPAPAPAPAATRAPTPPVARELDFGAPPARPPGVDSPSLIAPSPARAIQIPLMTPVRKRRGLHAASVLTGLAAGLVAVAVAGGGWLYLAASQSGSKASPAPLAAAPRPASRPTPPAPTPAPAPVARVIPEPTPAPIPAPVPAPALVAQPVTPPPAPVPATAPAPTAAVTPSPSPAPIPIDMPNSHPAPTTVVIVRPANPAPPPTVPAAPDGSAVTPPVPTAAGFELSPSVRRFVDDWLRAQETHDAQLFTSLGFRELPTELAGSWTTRDGYRLVAAAIDEERSTPELVYLRVVVSYAFRDGTGRFRTEDEERMILRNSASRARFEGRWQQ